ncbi:hypothetical protein FAGAP_5866 [Fusarium agapanthi]|uniref:Uncharacterized protein n=1 Tax=Fusarium agapanthi TaxID=1803897 RepID=A0A9P5B998_9HYPO|nr:hypothetical protein FAGAP_5866 [Fusarium agapanthi]
MTIDKTLKERLALQRKIVSEHFDMVIASEPCSEAAVKEFTSGWSKNTYLEEIHGPVPGYKEKLERPMSLYFTSLPKGKVVKRHNWNIPIGHKLFVTRENPLTVLPLWLMGWVKPVLDWLGIEVLKMKSADLNPEEMNVRLTESTLPNVPINTWFARSLSLSFLFLLPTGLRSHLSHQPSSQLSSILPFFININHHLQQLTIDLQPYQLSLSSETPSHTATSPTNTTTTLSHQELNMVFLELTAPRSSFAESTSTISSQDNKLVALTPPAPAFAEITNSTSAEVDVDNTDKVSLKSPIKNHELKEPKAFDQMIAHLNAMRAKVQALESENKELKSQIEYEKSFKEHFTNSLDEANRNWHLSEIEAATKVQALESVNSEFKAQVEYEKSFKEHYSQSLDEANRNWHAAEFNAAAKEAELGRVRERLTLVEAQAAEKAQIHAYKEHNIQLQAQFRVQFILTTHHHVQTIKHMMHDWKVQVEQKIDDDFEKNKEKEENDSTSPLDAEYERLKSLIEGHDHIIANIKKGNEKFVSSIKNLREPENPTLISDLTADRFEAFLNEREKMVAQLEVEKQDQMTEDAAEDMIEIPIETKETTKADRKKAKKAAKKAKKANAKK